MQASEAGLPQLLVWRHPRPQAAQGRCIGQTDLAIDRRKVKRLAHRIRQAARRHGWPRVIHTSPLQRCARVGRQLRQWGWEHHVHPAVMEVNFGAWDGLPWTQISHAEVDAWCARFATYSPGGGECLLDVFSRAATWLRAHQTSSAQPLLMVGHGGWMLAARWVLTQEDAPTDARQWPRPAQYGECWALSTGPIQYRPVAPAIHK